MNGVAWLFILFGFWEGGWWWWCVGRGLVYPKVCSGSFDGFFFDECSGGTELMKGMEGMNGVDGIV